MKWLAIALVLCAMIGGGTAVYLQQQDQQHQDQNIPLAPVNLPGATNP